MMEKWTFQQKEKIMRTQTYYHTSIEAEANRRNDTVPLQVNCAGVVSSERFLNRSVRKDYYYIYVLQGKMVLGECTLEPGDVFIYEPERSYQYRNEGKTVYLCNVVNLRFWMRSL